jgi:hypothetical protein
MVPTQANAKSVNMTIPHPNNMGICIARTVIAVCSAHPFVITRSRSDFEPGTFCKRRLKAHVQNIGRLFLSFFILVFPPKATPFNLSLDVSLAAMEGRKA